MLDGRCLTANGRGAEVMEHGGLAWSSGPLIFLTVAVAGYEGLDGGEVRWSKERTSPSPAHAELAELATGNNRFAFYLYQSL